MVRSCTPALRFHRLSATTRLLLVIGFCSQCRAHSAISAAFEQALKALGWTNGSNLRVDYRWAARRCRALRKLAAEIIALAPDVILMSGTSVVAPMMQATRTIPIVFVQVIDPVGSGFVKSLARPGGNITGFTQFEYSLAAKWVELLKQIAPHVTRAAVIRDPTRGYGIGQFAVVQAIAPSLGMELSPINAPDVSEIESAIAAFARSPNGGLVVALGGTALHRDVIIALAAKHRLPAVYPYRYFVSGGGLISYGPIRSTNIGARLITSIVFSRARSRPTCRCRRRPSTIW